MARTASKIILIAALASFWLSCISEATLLENIPLDSWIYGVVDELHCQGLFSSLHTNVRPYTRGEIASLVLAWLVLGVELLLVFLISGQGLQLLAALLLAVPKLVELTINIFLFSILIQVILSWVNPGVHNPAISVIHSLTEPLLAPARRRIPPMGGLDLSPMVVMIGLVLLEMLLIPPLEKLVLSLV